MLLKVAKVVKVFRADMIDGQWINMGTPGECEAGMCAGLHLQEARALDLYMLLMLLNIREIDGCPVDFRCTHIYIGHCV